MTLRVSRALTIIVTRLGLWHHRRRARGIRTCSTFAVGRRMKRIALSVALLLTACRAGGFQCSPFFSAPEEYLQPCRADGDCGDELQCLSRPSRPEEFLCSIECGRNVDCEVAFNDTSGCHVSCSEGVCGGSLCD